MQPPTFLVVRGQDGGTVEPWSSAATLPAFFARLLRASGTPNAGE
jgi:hypothetical protein